MKNKRPIITGISGLFTAFIYALFIAGPSNVMSIAAPIALAALISMFIGFVLKSENNLILVIAGVISAILCSTFILFYAVSNI